MSNISTTDFIKNMTLDQLKYLVELSNKKIKAAEEGEKRIVWRVSSGWLVEENFREEDFEKASELLVKIYKEKFDKMASEFLKERGNIYYFKDELPCVYPERVTQIEYDTEWFPKK